MILCDTHSHIFDEAFDADRAEVVERARAAGLDRIILPAIDGESHPRLLETLSLYPDICRGAMGVHPTSLTTENIDAELSEVEHLLDCGVEWVAIGEIGLDYYWSREHVEAQHRALRCQLDWSLERGLPVIIHTRDAWDDMTALLEEYSGRGLRGVMHAFCGSVEHYQRIRRTGDWVFGIGGVVTYKKGGVAEVVAQMELRDLVLETDAPYLTPVPHRGRRNEPSYVIHTAHRIVEVLGIDITTVASATRTNTSRIFGI